MSLKRPKTLVKDPHDFFI